MPLRWTLIDRFQISVFCRNLWSVSSQPDSHRFSLLMLSAIALFSVRQSAYRRYHSTEKVVVDQCAERCDTSCWWGKVTHLVLLDLSSAYDTVESTTNSGSCSHFSNGVFFSRARRSTGSAHIWTIEHRSFEPTEVNRQLCRIAAAFHAQGSVLGPVEFISYSEDVVTRHPFWYPWNHTPSSLMTAVCLRCDLGYL